MNSNVTNIQEVSSCEIRKTEVLTACDHFAESVFKITTDLRTHGYTNRILPNFPKAALLNIMGLEKQPRKVLRGEDLNHYLYSKIIISDILTLPTPEECPHDSLDDLINKLFEGNRILREKYAKVLGCSLIYGQWLHVAFKYLNDLPGHRVNWEKWLIENNIGIKVSHARMLRTLAKKFYKYKRFHSLSIPLTEFWNKRKEIEEMLQNDEIAKYWEG